eukprot:3934894-Rhodomonas_salina.5
MGIGSGRSDSAHARERGAELEALEADAESLRPAARALAAEAGCPSCECEPQTERRQLPVFSGQLT